MGSVGQSSRPAARPRLSRSLPPRSPSTNSDRAAGGLGSLSATAETRLPPGRRGGGAPEASQGSFSGRRTLRHPRKWPYVPGGGRAGRGLVPEVLLRASEAPSPGLLVGPAPRREAQSAHTVPALLSVPSGLEARGANSASLWKRSRPRQALQPTHVL